VNKQYQDLHSGEFYWTDEYVESLEQTIKAIGEVVEDMTGRNWTLRETQFPFEKLQAIIKGGGG